MIGGATGFPAGYAAAFDAVYAPILAELGGQYVDVFDFHWYGSASGEYHLRDTASGQDMLDHISGTLSSNGFPADVPIWITEMGSYSGDPERSPDPEGSPSQTERQQASDYFKRFIYFLSRGVEKIFPAFGLMEGFKHDNGYSDHTGLMYDGSADADDLGLGVKKLAYYTYKKMTEKLEGADWSTLITLHDGTEDDHLYLFPVEKVGQPIHIAWWDYFDELAYTPGDTKAITLNGLAGKAVTATAVVPFADIGQEVTDYEAAFTATTYPVLGGAVTILLGEDPVLVEGGAGVSYSTDLPLVLKDYWSPVVTPTPTPTLCAADCDAITPVDNSLYYARTEDECWHVGDLPSAQAWFEEAIAPGVGSATTPLYFGIGVHVEPHAEYADDVVYQRDRERLRRLGDIVVAHGGVLTIQTQTPFNTKAQEIGDTIFADLASQGHEIALHFHEDWHIPDADNQDVQVWVEVLQEQIDRIETLSGTQVCTWSGGNTHGHLFEAAEIVGLRVSMNYKNRYSQQSDERFTILTPWRPTGAATIEERTSHDPDGAVVYVPSGVFPAHCEKLEAFPRPYCHEAFDYVTVALRNSLRVVTDGKVNAFYATLHPGDFFGPGSDEEKLRIWDEWLTEIVDPLVSDGRVQWATMSEIAEAFVAWEESCGDLIP